MKAISSRSDRMIPLHEPALAGNEWIYLKECLDTKWVSSVGPFVRRFETALAEYVGASYAVATVNGTAALHIALLVAGVQPHDEVLMPALTFIAPANAVRYCGGWPVFVDAEKNYWQMDSEQVEKFLTTQCRRRRGNLVNVSTGRRVKAIIPVHILGHPVDMDHILELARYHDLVVIEDATESLGAKYKGRMVGTLGDIACFSFNGNKVITTGGGGMIVTNRSDWAERARYLTEQAKDDPVEYVHHAIGFNYRLTNLQAAVGCAQMEQLDRHLTAKRSLARTYTDFLAGVTGITVMPEANWALSTFWMYTVLVDKTIYGVDSRMLMRHLEGVGIQTRPLWQPLHTSPAHRESPSLPCPVAEGIAREALSLPSSPGLNSSDQQRVIEHVASLHNSD